jgi:hypothetical protein
MKKISKRLVKIVREKVIIGQHANLLIRTYKLFNYMNCKLYISKIVTFCLFIN